MNETKRLKDPIYGYVEIPSQFFYSVIDSACFQRLRRIIQTSYSPLYSSAVHNRFVHSIGVFHLGEMASARLTDEIIKKGFLEEKKANELKGIFVISCLLHDVGHAPFSHTGEEFFLDIDDNSTNKYMKLHDTLSSLIDLEEFKRDIPQNGANSAKAHEIMSAIIGLREFETLFHNSEEKSFFARCITGYKYKVLNRENEIKNCYIQLLNSNTIDVDKLDYLIRDAYSTGFDTVKIDYERLLRSLTIVKVENDDEDHFEFAYYKSAISVLENVIYAHDAERKWIQNHPVVLYESYLLKNIMLELQIKYNNLFSIDSLSLDGQKIDENTIVRLLSDDDIIFLIKKLLGPKGEGNELAEEYFCRSSRRHPIWKSESEYKYYFDVIMGDGNIAKQVKDSIKATVKYMAKNSNTFKLDTSLLEQVQKEIDEVKAWDCGDATKDAQLRNKEKVLLLTKTLLKYAEEKNIERDFVIISATQFNSGFGKPDFRDANIVFNNNEKPAKAKEVVLSFESANDDKDDFYFIYYKRNDNSKISGYELSRYLLMEFLKTQD